MSGGGSKTQRRLGRRFFRRDPVSLARALLGRVLVREDDAAGRLAGRIVETEAYLGEPDHAAHSFGGRRTQRNRSMYLDAGHAYVYFTYGMHFCFNITAEEAERPTACLIRALQPLEGLGAMRRHRAGRIPASRLRETDLCSGPAKLCRALRIDRELDGEDLTRSRRLYLERGAAVAARHIVAAGRVGVAYAGPWAHKPLRFYIRDNPHVSVRRPG